MGNRSARSRQLAVVRLDKYFERFTAIDGATESLPAKGWVNAIRHSLGMSATQLAKRLGVSRASVYKMESREVQRSVTLAQLDKAAAALECQLVYRLVPNKTLEQTIRNRANVKAEAELRAANQSMGLEAEGLTDDALLGPLTSASSYSEALTDRRLWDD